MNMLLKKGARQTENLVSRDVWSVSRLLSAKWIATASTSTYKSPDRFRLTCKVDPCALTSLTLSQAVQFRQFRTMLLLHVTCSPRPSKLPREILEVLGASRSSILSPKK
jgi:hypothetical protein